MVSRLRQEQVVTVGSGINDALTPSDHDSNAVDLRDTIDHIASQFADVLGESNWYDTPDASIATIWAKTFLDEKLALRRIPLLTSITIANGANFKILSVASSEIPSGKVKAVGDVQTKGLVCATNASFGAHDLAEVSGATALAPKNLLLVWDVASGDELNSSNRRVYGLLQSETGATDGAAFTDVTPERAQVSFVRPNATYDDLEACPVADIQDKVINLGFCERQDLESWVEQDFLHDVTMMDLGAAGAVVTLDQAIDNQGATAATATTNIEIRQSDSTSWTFETSDGARTLLGILPAAAGDEIEINTDTFDVNVGAAGVIDFDNGMTVDSGGTAINVGVTAGRVDATALELEATAGNLKLESSAVIDVDGASLDMDLTGGLAIDAAADMLITLTGNSADPVTLALTALNEGAGDGSIVIGADDVAITAVYGAMINTGDDSSFSMIADDAADKTLTLSAANAGVGAGNVAITADDAITMSTTSAVVGITAGTNLNMLAGGVFTLDGTGNSNVTATSGDLVISTTTSGELDLTSADLMDINAGANLDIDVTGTFDMLSSGAFSIDGTGASNVSAAAGNLTVATTGSGNLVLSAAGAVDMDGVGVTIDSTSTLSVDSADTTNLTMTANDAGAKTMTISAVNGGAGAGNLTIDADDTMLFTATTFDADVSSFDLDASGGVTLDGSTISLTAASSDINISAASGDVDIDGATLTVDITGAMSLDSADSSNITMTTSSADEKTLTISGTNAGVGGGHVTVSAEDNLSLSGTYVYIGSTTQAVYIESSNSNVSLNAANGTIDINGGAIDVDGSTIDLSATSTLALAGLDTTSLSMSANDAADKTLTIEASNIGAGVGNVLISADGDVSFTTVRETAIELDDAVVGAISGLFGQSFGSIAAAINYAGSTAGTSFEEMSRTVLASAYAKDANVPAASFDQTGYTLDAAGDAATMFVYYNGQLLDGADAADQGDVYPGTTPASGDLKFSFPDGVFIGDVIICIGYK